jgi:lipopolysaccharide/colanic/teichoic acid biosynthesis glycosyltransferase
MSMLREMNATGHSANTAEFDQRTPQNIPAINTRSNTISVKRALDIFGAMVALVFFAPVMSIIYIVLMCTGGKPVFAHRRVGQNGGLFPCYKFRSMVRNSDEVFTDYLERNPAAREEWDYTCKLTYDPRVTGFGMFLRRSSLDELPQLFNVLKGDMSLVGPRPILPEEVERYCGRIRAYYQCTPGITGLWQVSGRNDLDYDRRVRLDALYARKRCTRLDMIILIRTVRVVLSGRGAR